MKFFQLCVFSLMFFMMNSAIADYFSDEISKNPYNGLSKLLSESEKCKKLRENLESIKQEISERNIKIREIQEDRDRFEYDQPYGRYLFLGAVTYLFSPFIGTVFFGTSALSIANAALLRPMRLNWHNSRLDSTQEKYDSLMRECKKKGCSGL